MPSDPIPSRFKLQYAFKVLICTVVLLLPQLTIAQGILVLSNTNQRIDGEVDETYGTRIPVTVGYNQGGYQLTGFAIMFGDNSDADFTNVTISLYSANSPINLDTLVSTFNVPTPHTAGLHFFSWPTNVFLPGQTSPYPPTYYNFFVAPTFQIGSTKELSLAYTTSSNYTDNAGWTFFPEDSAINGDLNMIPIFNIFATVLPPPVIYPIHLTNTAVLSDKSFQFGFTNSPNLNFTTYATTNAALPFTNWLNAGNPTYLGTNYYQYNTGPGVITNSAYPRIFFRVTSP